MLNAYTISLLRERQMMTEKYKSILRKFIITNTSLHDYRMASEYPKNINYRGDGNSGSGTSGRTIDG
jgi:hypothetical protein